VLEEDAPAQLAAPGAGAQVPAALPHAERVPGTGG